MAERPGEADAGQVTDNVPAAVALQGPEPGAPAGAWQQQPRSGPFRALRLLDTDAGAAVAILLAVLLAFSPWWLGGRIIAPLDIVHEAFSPWSDGDPQLELHNHFTSDAVTQYIVYRAIAERSLAEDGRIGWSSLTGGGRPEYANTMALYGDWTMQLHRVLDFWTAWHVGLMAQLLIAAFGMLVLLRAERLPPATALLGALAFAGSTPLLFTLYHRWQLAAFAWVPWMIWAMLRWRRGSPMHWLLVPVFLCLAVAGGSLQTAAFTVIVLAALWAGWTWESRRRSGAWRLTLHFVAWGVLGAALAAYTLLPAVLTYLDAVDLHGGRSAPGYAAGPLQPLFSLAFIPLQAVPTLLGSPASLDLAKLFRADLAYIAFFGFVPTLVAMWCAAWRGTPAAARVLILAGLLIPLTPLVGALYHRVQIVFVLGGVWAFAHWWARAAGPSDAALRRMVGAACALAAVWLLASIGLWLAEARLTALVQAQVAGMIDAGGGGQLAGFREWLLGRAAHIVTELRIWYPAQLVTVAAVALGLYAVHVRRRDLSVATLVLVAAVALETGGLAVRWHTAVDPLQRPPWPVTADLAALRELGADARVLVARSHDGPAPFLPPNTLAMYGVATIDQYETVDLHGMWQAAGRSSDARTLGALAVTHAVAPRGTPADPGWRVVRAGSTFDIWQNEASVPRYIAVGARGAAEALELARGETDSHATGVHVVEATNNRRLLATAAGAHAVRVAENWSEGWEYRVDDGMWRQVQAAADRSMILALDGTDQARSIEMRYRPRRRAAGMAVSGVAGLLLLVGGLAGVGRAAWHARRSGHPVPAPMAGAS
jgi:hypothetical protein